jgi:hypothetical protein
MNDSSPHTHNGNSHLWGTKQLRCYQTLLNLSKAPAQSRFLLISSTAASLIVVAYKSKKWMIPPHTHNGNSHLWGKKQLHCYQTLNLSTASAQNRFLLNSSTAASQNCCGIQIPLLRTHNGNSNLWGETTPCHQPRSRLESDWNSTCQLNQPVWTQ